MHIYYVTSINFNVNIKLYWTEQFPLVKADWSQAQTKVSFIVLKTRQILITNEGKKK